MDIKELQELLDNAIKAIADSGCYIKDNKVIENKEVYVISANGIFYDEYMGDSDWRYRVVSGDKVITDEQAKILIDGIVDCMSVEDEDSLVKASKLLNDILEDDDDSFTRIYSTECAEFNNVTKSNDSIYFTDESENNWELEFNIHKKLLSDVEEFDIDERFGCI